MILNFTTKKHTLPDDRVLAYNEYGNKEGSPVFYLHGGPGSRIEGELLHSAAEKHGVRIISFDRPGMGLSDFQKNRTLCDLPGDIISLSDTLNLDDFGIIGFSGGGPYSIVSAYKIPQRLKFVFCISSLGSGVWSNALKYMQPGFRFAALLALKAPMLLQLLYSQICFLVKAFPQIYCSSFIKNICKSDRELFYSSNGIDLLKPDAQESFRRGSKGPAYDALLCYRDWGFRLEDVSFPVDVWHATGDTFVHFEIGRYISDLIPNSQLHAIENEGHFFLFSHLDELMESCKLAF